MGDIVSLHLVFDCETTKPGHQQTQGRPAVPTDPLKSIFLNCDKSYIWETKRQLGTKEEHKKAVFKLESKKSALAEHVKKNEAIH